MTCFLPTLSEILAKEGSDHLPDPTTSASTTLGHGTHSTAAQLKAQREWYGAVKALNCLLATSSQAPQSSPGTPDQGIVISGPSPVLTHPEKATHLASWVFASEAHHRLDQSGVKTAVTPLLPAPKDTPSVSATSTPIFSLQRDDPLSQELFCLVLTSQFSLVMVLGVNANHEPSFLFSFDPEIVSQGLTILRCRMLLDVGAQPSIYKIPLLDQLIAQFPPVAPHYKIVTGFSRLLLHHLPSLTIPVGLEKEEIRSVVSESTPEKEVPGATTQTQNLKDIQILQAFAHEVRTPLTTIRTLTRLLLRRPKINPDTLRQRLEMIDAECTTQINRFDLMFRAMELEIAQIQRSVGEHPVALKLTAIPLAEVFQNSIPRWQKQASQRNHQLEVVLPPKLPTVVSDPTMLEQMLTGMIENFSRNLPAGSYIQVGVQLAGNQLKLQLESHSPTDNHQCPFTQKTQTPFQSIGPLLIFQPETGCLSLNLSVTKNLFQAIGGKLVVRQRPQQGEVMTIFLPLQ